MKKLPLFSRKKKSEEDKNVTRSGDAIQEVNMKIVVTLDKEGNDNELLGWTKISWVNLFGESKD